jgi:dinuclear metal center YbgI/SA1388 family protein
MSDLRPTPATGAGLATAVAEPPGTAAPTLRDVVEVLDEVYPRDLAEPWDAVGLVAGDLDLPVARVLLAVDVTAATVAEALEGGADLLLVHHPLFLHGVHGVGTDTWKGRLVHRLVRAGCALFTAHTNADAAAPGVSDALARVIGLTDLRPLVPGRGVAPVGLGRVGTLSGPTTLGSFAEHVGRVLPRTASGVRVAGPLDAEVSRVAVCGGAGDGLLDAARASGADVFVTSDLRHHVASASVAGGPPWLVDVAHWASEWPWLLGARERLMARLAVDGRTIEARVSTASSDPWTIRL